jgi:hypothetical protein
MWATAPGPPAVESAGSAPHAAGIAVQVRRLGGSGRPAIDGDLDAGPVALPLIICGTDDRPSTSTTELGPRPYLAAVAALLATVIEAARQ